MNNKKTPKTKNITAEMTQKKINSFNKKSPIKTFSKEEIAEFVKNSK